MKAVTGYRIDILNLPFVQGRTSSHSQRCSPPESAFTYPCVCQLEGDRGLRRRSFPGKKTSGPIITESGLQSYYCSLSSNNFKAGFFLFWQSDNERSSTTRYKDENCKPNNAGYWIRILSNKARCIVTSVGAPSINTQRQGILKYTAQGSSPRKKRTQGTGYKALIKAT